MRGTRSLAAIALVLLVLIPTALHVAAQEPEPRDAPRFAPDTTRLREWTGQSVLHFRGACLDDGSTCVGDVTRDDGSFFLEAAAQAGSVTVSWRPANESLRVLRVHVAGIVVEGESPLRVDFSGLEAGEHAVRLEPARRVVGYHEQVADWFAAFEVTTPFDTLETRGRSTHTTVLGCVLMLCDPLTHRASYPLIVPWDARGTLVVDWDPELGDMRIAIPGTGFAAEGATPLTIPLDGLTAGEWEVELTPTGVTIPTEEISVGWMATLARA